MRSIDGVSATYEPSLTGLVAMQARKSLSRNSPLSHTITGQTDQAEI
jgi:hypothetical protein